MMFRTHDEEISMIKKRLQGGNISEKIQSLARLVELDNFNVNIDEALIPSLQVAPTDNKQQVNASRYCNFLIENNHGKNSSYDHASINRLMHNFTTGNVDVQILSLRTAAKIADDYNMPLIKKMIYQSTQSPDPMLRKTTALSLISINKANPKYISNYQLETFLQLLIQDQNINVVSSALVALNEINKNREYPAVFINEDIVSSIFSSISEANEWEIVQIIDFISNFTPESKSTAIAMIRHLFLFLDSPNAGVIFASTKALLHLSFSVDMDMAITCIFKCVKALNSLLKQCPLIVMTALKAILLLVENYRMIEVENPSIYFCNYDDPRFVKEAKINLLSEIVNRSNVELIGAELLHLTQQPDNKIIEMTMHAIGKIAIEYAPQSKECIHQVITLLHSNDPFIVGSSIKVISMILRRYPGVYDDVLITEFSKTVSKGIPNKYQDCSAWIVGEYCNIIPDAEKIIHLMVEGFPCQLPETQIAIIGAIAKFTTHNRMVGMLLFEKVFDIVDQESINPDVKERARFYKALLGFPVEVARKVLFSSKDNIITGTHESNFTNDEDLSEIIGTAAMLTGVLPKIKHRIVPTERLSSGERLPVLIRPEIKNHVEVRGKFEKDDSILYITLDFKNYAKESLTVSSIKLGPNIYGIAIEENQLVVPEGRGSRSSISIKTTAENGASFGAEGKLSIPLNLIYNEKRSLSVQVPIDLEALMLGEDENRTLSPSELVELMDSRERLSSAFGDFKCSLESIQDCFRGNNIWYYSTKANETIFYCRMITEDEFVVSLSEVISGYKIRISGMNGVLAHALLLHLGNLLL